MGGARGGGVGVGEEDEEGSNSFHSVAIGCKKKHQRKKPITNSNNKRFPFRVNKTRGRHFLFVCFVSPPLEIRVIFYFYFFFVNIDFSFLSPEFMGTRG